MCVRASVCGLFCPPTGNYVSKSNVTQDEEAFPCNGRLRLRKMFCHGVTSVIFISFSCATQLFTIQRRDPEPGWSQKHCNTQWHRNIVPDRLPTYWKTQGRNFFLPEIGAVRILLRKKLRRDALHRRKQLGQMWHGIECVQGECQLQRGVCRTGSQVVLTMVHKKTEWIIRKWFDDSWGAGCD